MKGPFGLASSTLARDPRPFDFTARALFALTTFARFRLSNIAC